MEEKQIGLPLVNVKAHITLKLGKQARGLPEI